MGRPDDAVQWLSSDERAAWLAVTALTMKLPSALDAQLQADEGLSFFEYMVLAVLSEQDDRTLQMSVIATATSASLSRLSHTMTRLERQGFVRRGRMPGAGRRTSATLTDAGYRKVVEAAPGHVARVRELVIDAISPAQLKTLRKIGAQVMARIDPDHPGNSGEIAWV
ncbi:MarR family transcriptional regulator [Microlunatus elymi]|uniref:MarR family transcriptional regulator n=1 Tax=Microlunatus elymi TaxID=2596828 RepID=A0A516Q2Q0_9ACTN|nr:MarR family transcriptional regulator [Microlunatus elymi]QDP97710.1 MarR family transcriptional regulator [Microlunatus elymi]